MTSIPDYMSAKHRECDEVFSLAESNAAAGDWPLATENWQVFKDELLIHFTQEEETLFPAFEQATGMTGGPTHVMRMEHQQMRALLQDIDQAIKNQDKNTYLGLSETLMVMMQQHNMKEEMMLYPMMAQHLSQGEEIIESFKA